MTENLISQTPTGANTTTPPAAGWRAEGDPPYFCNFFNVGLKGGRAELSLNLSLDAIEAKPFLDAGNKYFADFQTRVDRLIRESPEFIDWSAAAAKVKKLLASAAEYRNEIAKAEVAADAQLHSKHDLDDSTIFGPGDLHDQLKQVEKTLAKVQAIETEKVRALHQAAKRITNKEVDSEVAEYLTAEKELGGLITAASDALNKLISLQCRRNSS